jgi:hypothetical protein
MEFRFRFMLGDWLGYTESEMERLMQISSDYAPLEEIFGSRSAIQSPHLRW